MATAARASGEATPLAASSPQSVIRDLGPYSQSCGYCHSESDTSFAHGILAQKMTVYDYQDLIDRGWRRSGNILYKPDLCRTCCPQYTIRLHAPSFRLSKSQQQLQRRWERYVAGTWAPGSAADVDMQQQGPGMTSEPKASGGSTSASAVVEELQQLLAAALVQAVSDGCLPAASYPPVRVAPIPAKLKAMVPVGAEYCSSAAFAVAAAARKAAGGNSSSGSGGGASQAPSASAAPLPLGPDRVAEILAERFNRGAAAAATAAVAAAAAAGSSGQTAIAAQPVAQAAHGHLNITAAPQPPPPPPPPLAASVSGATDMEIGSPAATPRAVEGAAASPVPCAAGGGNRSNAPPPQPELQPQPQEQQQQQGAMRPHSFEFSMAPASFVEEEYRLYVKYQMRQHGDDINEVTRSKYTKFLVDSPLAAVPRGQDPAAPPCGYGCFHQQYRLDGKLVAVGVVDILPRCLSSVYLFWDPDAAALAPGKFTALREIQWVQEQAAAAAAEAAAATVAADEAGGLAGSSGSGGGEPGSVAGLSSSSPSAASQLQYYYMGYYIHSCPKMRYKAEYSPSDLLCPEAMTWVPVCRPLLAALDAAPYVALSKVPGTPPAAPNPALPELEARARGGGQWRQLVSRLLADKALVSVKGLPVMTWRALKDAGVVVAGFVKRLQGELEQWVALAGQSATTTVCCELS